MVGFQEEAKAVQAVKDPEVRSQVLLSVDTLPADDGDGEDGVLDHEEIIFSIS